MDFLNIILQTKTATQIQIFANFGTILYKLMFLNEYILNFRQSVVFYS